MTASMPTSASSIARLYFKAMFTCCCPHMTDTGVRKVSFSLSNEGVVAGVVAVVVAVVVAEASS